MSMSMFQRLMTVLTTAAFVAHVLCGCCWHDGHDGAKCDKVTAGASSQPVGCCKHCHDRADEKGPPAHGPCKLHCRGVCIYVSPQKSQLDTPQIDLRLDFAAVVVLHADGHPLAAAEVRGGADDPRRAEPPVRLHLLHQIFLI